MASNLSSSNDGGKSMRRTIMMIAVLPMIILGSCSFENRKVPSEKFKVSQKKQKEESIVIKRKDPQVGDVYIFDFDPRVPGKEHVFAAGLNLDVNNANKDSLYFRQGCQACFTVGSIDAIVKDSAGRDGIRINIFSSNMESSCEGKEICYPPEFTHQKELVCVEVGTHRCTYDENFDINDHLY